MSISKQLKIFLVFFVFFALFTTKSFAAGTINLVESSTSLTQEGLYVDVVVSGTPAHGVQFVLGITAANGATVTDVHATAGRKYVYPAITATILPNNPISSSGTIEIMAISADPNIDSSQVVDGYVTTLFLKPSASGTGTVHISFNRLEEGLTPLATAYTYDLTKKQIRTDTSYQTDTTIVTPIENEETHVETQTENLPQTSLFDISTRNAIIAGIVLLLVGVFFTKICGTTQSVVVASKNARVASASAIKEHRRTKRREKFEDKF